MSDRRPSSSSATDDPPNSRLFIVGSRSLCEDDYRQAFAPFGNIEELWMVKDRGSGEYKGVTYIKYGKTSEAAKALEAMNGKNIGGVNRSIKVMIAASRDQGSKRDSISNEEEKTQRLFVMVPKTMTDTELYDNFKAFGDIDYATLIRDRDTRENKGFAYVKYFKFSHAAAAFEQCDRKFRPVFAEPRKSQRHLEDKYFSNSNNSYDSFMKPSGAQHTPPPSNHNNSNNENYTKLIVIGSPLVNQDQLWRLFDIVPGMDYCQLRYEGESHRPPVRFVAEVVYTEPQWAIHAKEKLHGFEYPPGFRLIVKPDYDSMSHNTNKKSGGKNDILQLAETIVQATSLIQAAGISPEVLQSKLGNKDMNSYNSILPDVQPLANVDTETAARCFIVCTPHPPPNSVLKDMFCRFGNLIDVYMLPNRNCGYAKFATQESADDARKVLHGFEVVGVRMKVLKAEEKPDYQRKRQRVDE